MLSRPTSADDVVVVALLELSEQASSGGNYKAGAVYAQQAADAAEMRGAELLLASALRVFARQQFAAG